MTKNSGSTQSIKPNFDFFSRNKYRYSDSYSAEYNAWYSMIRRCYYSKTQYYSNYGGRGIKVCDRWLGSDGFDNFYLDMGPKPSSKLSLDRKDNDGDYSPENCRWTTLKKQARNRRSNKLYSLGGEEKTLIEWSEIYNIKYSLVKDRVRDGWALETALTTPKKRVYLSIGRRFNSWVVLEKLDGVNKYRCKCDCGNEAVVSRFDLTNSRSTQCKSCSKIGNKYAMKE